MQNITNFFHLDAIFQKKVHLTIIICQITQFKCAEDQQHYQFGQFLVQSIRLGAMIYFRNYEIFFVVNIFLWICMVLMDVTNIEGAYAVICIF